MKDKVLERRANLFLLASALKTNLMEALAEDLLLTLFLYEHLSEGARAVSQSLPQQNYRLLKGVDLVSSMRSMQCTLRTHQLATSQAEVNDFLVLVDLAVINLHSFQALRRSPRRHI